MELKQFRCGCFYCKNNQPPSLELNYGKELNFSEPIQKGTQVLIIK